MKTDINRSIDSLWMQLLSSEVGVMRKLDDIKAPFYLMASNNVKSFLYTIPKDKKVDILPKKYENVEIQLTPLTKDISGIIVSLTNSRLYSVFLVIASDIASSLMGNLSDEEALLTFVQKVNQWKSVFNRKYEAMLNPEQQLGLYGELFFMKSLIEEGLDPIYVLDAWKGAIKEDKDYLFFSVAVEIKSSSKTDKLVKISNIRQLDSTGFDHLFLYHYSFVKSPDGDRTLPAIIENLRSLFAATSNPEMFEEKRLCAGYLDKDADNYKTNYTHTNENCYAVIKDFPRITPTNVMINVLNAEYIIDLNASSGYIVSYQDFIGMIKL